MTDILLSLKVQPGVSRNELTRVVDGTPHLKIAAPPVEGRANKEMLLFLSELLGVKKGSISLVKGHASHSKVISISGLTAEDVMLRFSARLSSGGG
jgi:uncharacterized protein (TIGR00251 family)